MKKIQPASELSNGKMPLGQINQRFFDKAIHGMAHSAQEA
jgi:hypothetical protein